MKKHSKLKRLIIGLIILFVVMQFFRIDKTNPQSDPANDFIASTNPPTEIAVQIKESCYDCHSNNTRYPWYTNVAPVSWYVKNHIDEGREHLNFSEWGNFDNRRKEHKLEECIELVSKDIMPMSDYVMMHSKSELSPEKKQALLDWLKSVNVVEETK